MRDLKSKYRLFPFNDGSILDVSKIDCITENKSCTKYIVQINGRILEMDKDDEAERLIETWDMYIRNEETNAELMYKQAKINGADLDIISKKIDLVLAMYSRVHKDIVPEFPLDKKEG